MTVVCSRGREGGAEAAQLEVAHESLFKVWDTLERWIREDKDFLKWRRDLDLAKGQGPLQGPLLEKSWRYLKTRTDDLQPEQADFIRASMTVRRKRIGVLAGITCVALSAVVGLVYSELRGQTHRQIMEAWGQVTKWGGEVHYGPVSHGVTIDLPSSVHPGDALKYLQRIPHLSLLNIGPPNPARLNSSASTRF